MQKNEEKKNSNNSVQFLKTKTEEEEKCLVKRLGDISTEDYCSKKMETKGEVQANKLTITRDTD